MNATVLIPCRNYGRFLGEAIDSVLDQDAPPGGVEILVVDDGSRDETPAVAARYGDRVRYLRVEEGDKSAATFAGIAAARGRYLFNLDADDRFLPGKIRRVLEAFEGDPGLVMVAHPPVRWETANGSRLAETVVPEFRGRALSGPAFLSAAFRRLGGNPGAMGSTFAARLSALRQVPPVRGVGLYVDLYLVLFTARQGSVRFLDDALSLYRLHEKNGSLDLDLSRGAALRLSMLEPLLERLRASGHPEDVKALFELRVRILRLVVKEQAGTKTFADVLSLWRFVAGHGVLLAGDLRGVLRDYWVVQKSLPAPLRRLGRGLRRADGVL
ncbi:MAG: glycosyltransferase family 2 protein [Elusimicrobia bacterium]|nr:glycosyltransferase family 2 protein [Elusimicrobiota bacterium]